MYIYIWSKYIHIYTKFAYGKNQARAKISSAQWFQSTLAKWFRALSGLERNRRHCTGTVFFHVERPVVRSTLEQWFRRHYACVMFSNGVDSLRFIRFCCERRIYYMIYNIWTLARTAYFYDPFNLFTLRIHTMNHFMNHFEGNQDHPGSPRFEWPSWGGVRYGGDTK